MRNGHTANNDLISLTESMDIKALPDSHSAVSFSISNDAGLPLETAEDKTGQCQISGYRNLYIIRSPLNDTGNIACVFHGRGSSVTG